MATESRVRGSRRELQRFQISEQRQHTIPVQHQSVLRSLSTRKYGLENLADVPKERGIFRVFGYRSDDKNFSTFHQVNCRGYNAFGRRRRDVDAELNDTGLSVSEGFDGQLREEITITSNLIRTMERIEERYPSDTASGNINDVFKKFLNIESLILRKIFNT